MYIEPEADMTNNDAKTMNHLPRSTCKPKLLMALQPPLPPLNSATAIFFYLKGLRYAHSSLGLTHEEGF